MILFLQPNDTFFFRDGRPFTRGVQSEGYPIFPPLPPTILGALRTAYIAECSNLSSFYAGEEKIAKMIGTSDPDSLGSIQLKGFFLADKQSAIYFPIPLDLIVKKNEKEDVLYMLACYPEIPDFISNAPLKHHLKWNGAENVESETGGKLTYVYLREYLLNRRKNFGYRSQEDFVCEEPKIGIQRNRKTLASEEGMLYRINMSRFKSRPLGRSQLGFVVDYQCNEKLPKKGLLKLGGEGKSFTYEQSCCNPDPFPTKEDRAVLKEAIRCSGAFKLYFATPAIFNSGWLPKWVDKKTYQAQYPASGPDSLSFELITAAVGKPISIGGWDMKKNIPKPTRRAVPAGSVYYFKVIDSNSVDAIVNTFHYENISDYQAKEGFGLCFVGVAEGDKL